MAGYSLFGNAELEPMVVVESRTPQPLSEASPWVTRISRILNKGKYTIYQMHYGQCLAWRLLGLGKLVPKHRSSVAEHKATMSAFFMREEN